MTAYSDDMVPCLFVYGTLRRGLGYPMGAYLARHAEWLGLARVPGRLYDLGQYPGVLEPAGPDDRVRGDLFRIHTPARVLRALDRFEGYRPGDARPWLFERVLSEATTDDGVRRPAWVYLWRRRVSEAQRVPSGEYRP